jgi:hypothetical protein
MRVDINELTDLDQEYYVIVGCGFSAVTNHAILARQPAGVWRGRTGTTPIGSGYIQTVKVRMVIKVLMNAPRSETATLLGQVPKRSRFR